MNKILKISNLAVSIENKSIISKVDLEVGSGQIHAIMGPNGSGKSTLSYTLMGKPGYNVSSGTISFNGEDLKPIPVNIRAKKGIFLAFQYPYEVEGVTLKTFLRQSYRAIYRGTDRELDFDQFEDYLDEKRELLNINPEFLQRSLNVGFSGGEKKRAEVLQLAVLQPKLAILDEIDSGLDVDALRTVCNGIQKVRQDNPDMAIIIITHYPHILHYLEPDFVHIMKNGELVLSGDKSLAYKIEKEGY